MKFALQNHIATIIATIINWPDWISRLPEFWPLLLIVIASVLVIVVLVLYRRPRRQNITPVTPNPTPTIEPSSPADVPLFLRKLQAIEEMVQVLYRDANKSARENEVRQLSESNRLLTEQQRRLDASLQSSQTALNKADAEIRNLKLQLEQTKPQLELFRQRSSVCVELLGDAVALRNLGNHLLTLNDAWIETSTGIQGFVTSSSLINDALLCEAADEVVGLWLRERWRELNDLIERKFSADVAVVGPYGGTKRTGKELADYISTKLYDEIVKPRFGKLFRRLQRFYLLQHGGQITEESSRDYSDALIRIQAEEAKITGTLRMLNMEPLKLAFFMPLSEDLKGFVAIEYTAVKQVYPKWRLHEPVRSSSVLDVTRWAYLTGDGQLRDDRAQVLVSE